MSLHLNTSIQRPPSERRINRRTKKGLADATNIDEADDPYHPL